MQGERQHHRYSSLLAHNKSLNPAPFQELLSAGQIGSANKIHHPQETQCNYQSLIQSVHSGFLQFLLSPHVLSEIVEHHEDKPRQTP